MHNRPAQTLQILAAAQGEYSETTLGPRSPQDPGDLGCCSPSSTPCDSFPSMKAPRALFHCGKKPKGVDRNQRTASTFYPEPSSEDGVGHRRHCEMPGAESHHHVATLPPPAL